jgi:redox-sensitive bicupin YhaK (pirin superfamily)
MEEASAYGVLVSDSKGARQMFGVASGTAFHSSVLPHGATAVTGPGAGVRPLALLASGRRHGPITRLITPWNIGEVTTPFVFLDYAEVDTEAPSLFGIKPHASIATLTLVLSGSVSFEDATGEHGEVRAGGLAWMSAAAHAVWRGGAAATGEPVRVFQLWISLSESQQSSSAASERIASDDMAKEGPARVLLGQLGRTRSPLLRAPADINCLRVTLNDGERWRYAAPVGHNVTWLAVDRGGLQLQHGERVYWEQIAVFGDSGGVIDAQADGDTSFLLGSARRQPPPLALQEYPFPAVVAPRVQAEPEPQWIAPRPRMQHRR